MNDRVLEMKVGDRCSGECAPYRERYGSVGEFSRLARHGCLDLTSESRNPRSSSATQHPRDSSGGVSESASMLDHPELLPQTDPVDPPSQ